MSASASSSPQAAPSAGVSLLEVRGVAKRFGARDVLKSISLDIAAGEFLTLLGESGSGKTTLLRLIAGFEQPTAGEIRMGGERLDTLPPYKRRVNTVFQHYALFPHLNVRDNVAYGLRVKGTPKNEIGGRVEEALRMVKMSEYADAQPSKLSGGQQQRVALARALVNRPQLLLLDEPLSALDANLRKQMQSELKALQREVGITFLFVTHDQEEAMALSDRIALLRDGALEQVASPREIYACPATAYTAQFIGQTNLLRGEVRGGVATCGALRWPISGSDGVALFSLRPEAISLAADEAAPPDAVRFRGVIRQQIYGGSSELLEVDCGNNQLLRVRIPACGPLLGEHEFVFSAADAIRVRE
ncbi:MAG TPA: ABC transporter ATP-binding protein [Candidatus Acidoferrum sp.]|nr:ABC transporter ATP-binding protein [Candidatus Acidoferrum sp.]